MRFTLSLWTAVLVLALLGCGQVTAPLVPTPSSLPSSADACHVKDMTYCALNPAVTQATIKVTICVVGWTATIRPPASYTSALKVQQIAAEHLSDTNPADYEEDHRMPLELGGAPKDVWNLSPEAHTSSSAKDADENAAKASVCSGAKTLLQAQTALVAKWLAVYPAYKQ